MRVLAVALVAGLLAFASTGFPETEPGTTSGGSQLSKLSSGAVEFGGGILMSFVDGSSLLDIEPVLGYFFTNELEAELEAGFMHTGSGGYSYNIATLLGKVLMNVNTGTLAVPYGFIGLGFTNYSVSHDSWGDDSEGGALLRFGGGTRLFVTRTWNLRAELQFEKVYIENMDDMSTNVMLYITGLVIP